MPKWCKTPPDCKLGAPIGTRPTGNSVTRSVIQLHSSKKPSLGLFFWKAGKRTAAMLYLLQLCYVRQMRTGTQLLRLTELDIFVHLFHTWHERIMWWGEIGYFVPVGASWNVVGSLFLLFLLFCCDFYWLHK